MDAPVAQPEPSDDIWFADGNIVLRAEDTLFKTYIGILANASSVFRDMFGVPQPPANDTERYEGLPLVRLPDTVWDITHFFKAIHVHGYAEGNRQFSIFSAILRMSIKYDVDYFRKFCIAKLEVLCPTDGQPFNMAASLAPKMFEDHVGHMYHAYVSLAQQPGLRFILPFVYLWMAPAGSDDGISWQWLRTPYVSADGRSYHLEQESILACLRGSWALADRHGEVIKAVFVPAPSCTSKDVCDRAFGNWRTDLLAPNLYWQAIDRWEHPVLVGYRGDFCDACWTLAGVVWTRELHTTWNLFPGFFGLPDWEELRKG